MSYRPIQLILFFFLLTLSAAAQVRTEQPRSTEERALRLEPFITASAKRYGVDSGVLSVLCFMESRYRLGAVSPKGARGPMQFIPETARRYGLNDPFDPKAAIDAAAHYLKDLLVKFGGRLDLALAGYNAGEGAVESFRTGKPLVLANGKVINPHRLITNGVPPYRETQDYVRSAIALLTSSHATGLKSFAFSIQRKNETVPSGARDFTLDAMSKDAGPTSRGREERSALFIEIE